MKRFALMLALAVGTVSWGELATTRMGGFYVVSPLCVAQQQLQRMTSVRPEGIALTNPTIWSHIGDDHAAVPPPVPVVVGQPSGLGGSMQLGLSSFQLLDPMPSPEPPGTVWLHIGNDHAAVPPPVPVVIGGLH